METAIKTPHEKVQAYLEQILESTDCYLVKFAVKPTNNYKIFLDSDTGFNLEKSIRINRQLRKLIEEENIYPEGDFSLEVSSPDVDEPLKLIRQYIKNIGRDVLVKLNNEEKTELEGTLVVANDEKIEIETKKTKKIESKKIEIEYTQIKSTVVCTKF